MRNRPMANDTGVNATTVNELTKLTTGWDPVRYNASPCRQTVLTDEEEELVLQWLLQVSARGENMGYKGLTYMMKGVAADGRRSFEGSVSSIESVRSFCGSN